MKSIAFLLLVVAFATYESEQAALLGNLVWGLGDIVGDLEKGVIDVTTNLGDKVGSAAKQPREVPKMVVSDRNQVQEKEKHIADSADVEAEQAALIGDLLKDVGGVVENVENNVLGLVKGLGTTVGSNLEQALKVAKDVPKNGASHVKEDEKHGADSADAEGFEQGAKIGDLIQVVGGGVENVENDLLGLVKGLGTTVGSNLKQALKVVEDVQKKGEEKVKPVVKQVQEDKRDVTKNMEEKVEPDVEQVKKDDKMSKQCSF